MLSLLAGDKCSGLLSHGINDDEKKFIKILSWTICCSRKDNLMPWSSFMWMKPGYFFSMSWNGRTRSINIFVQLVFNLSNAVTDTLESSTILIYLETPKSIYTQLISKMPFLMKWLIKRWLKQWPVNCIFSEWKGQRPKRFGGWNVWIWITKF